MFKRKPKPLISLLVPYKSTGDDWRDIVWAWLREYWQNLPDSEIVIGRDRGSRKRWWRKPRPFSKTRAINDAFRRAKGDIIVILDADAYLPISVVQHCAERLRACREVGVKTWFVPYQHLYRLTKEATEEVLMSLPSNPLGFSSPPPPGDVEGTDGSGHGRLFGAMCQIMPREAFVTAGGGDPRFVGWGGEDVALLKALDVLWGRHINSPNDVLHLWHKRAITGEWKDKNANIWEVRIWDGQSEARANDALASRYNNASHSRVKMQSLVDEHQSLRRLSIRRLFGR